MAEVKIKSVGWQEVPYGTAENVKRIWEDDKIPSNTKISVKNYTILKSDIGGVKMEDTDQKNKIYKESDTDFLTWKKQIINKTPEEKADIDWRRVDMLWWAGNHKQQMPEDVREKARALQIQFFTENKNRVTTNGAIYQTLFMPHIKNSERTYMSFSAHRIIENTEITDRNMKV